MDELKPCPCCGNKHVSDEIYHVTGYHYILCSDCGVEGPPDLGQSGAIEAWNTRPIEDALLAKLEAAEKAAENWREVHCDEIITERVVVFSALREVQEVIDLLADKLTDAGEMDYLTRRTTDKARKSIRDALKMQDTSKPEAK